MNIKEQLFRKSVLDKSQPCLFFAHRGASFRIF